MVVGGREGIRTPDPLLAKRVVESTKVLRWCRLHGKPSNFPFFKCPEVVPSSGSGNATQNGPLTNVPVSPRQIRQADHDLATPGNQASESDSR
jgi:hypothetical protein